MSDCQLAELGVIRIAAPCKVPWSSMTGTDAVRHCDQCKLNVFNVEHLTSYEVRDLILKTEGRVCMRMFKRFDGTLLTKDCPRAIEALGYVWRQSARRVDALGFASKLAGALVVLLFVFTFGTWFFGDNIRRLFGMSSMGALAGDPAIARQNTQPPDPRAPLFARFPSNRPSTQYGGPVP